ncbi:hypothetical protein LSH36_1111g01009 [Paralvinella palmiformis]|uniref:Arginase n=1 Tax=Paralvinella palmiformis TaxID=53620 RepID=A0AAD9IVJ0_9ANNE|nr:hypothetical protein LSH36_1111g01009 [Paralvinella palmiformis]
MSLYEKSIGVVGIPFDKGQPCKGVNLGPEVLRRAGAVKIIEQLGYDVKDYGDIRLEDIPNDTSAYGVKLPRTIGADMRRLSETVSQVVGNGAICLNLGGDHTLGIGSINGHLQVKPNAAVIWIDAHADLNPPLSSPSGNIHGMPLSFLVREVQNYMPKLPGFDWVKPRLAAQDIAFIGIRDVDKAEKMGIHQVVEGALNAVNPSFDIDALDSSICPSTGTPVSGGLTLREGMYIVEKIFRTGNLSVFDIAEVNPKLGTPEDVAITVNSAMSLIGAAFGKRTVDFIRDDYSIPKPN